ncbi:hypothetical protein GCM10010378_06730 [Streptomyces viridochromogenes]
MNDRMMKAVLHDRYGGPDVLYVGRVPRPEPGAGEVLVKVHAFSVNGGELSARAGRLRLLTGRSFPSGSVWTSPARSPPWAPGSPAGPWATASGASSAAPRDSAARPST